ncbi:unnamed protein product [Spirodela intermedia]|uniref:RING-type domain-containing protein n=1 Tax=Spirodela intermedia TaxID=51605 RepID=A0A7I8IVJ8_SPIIN|nr:unnamed protein product [Spirodela intermedia]CAA6662016.1 unnamed protein product [Spirodela intermedia]
MSSSYASSGLPETAAATNGVGLGYGIAIAVGILVLVSSIMLASYVCVRVKGGEPRLEDELRLPPSASYPKFVYGGRHRGAQPTPAGSPCPICLSEYRSGDSLRRIPDCEHCFHAACVDEWLRVSATCPSAAIPPCLPPPPPRWPPRSRSSSRWPSTPGDSRRARCNTQSLRPLFSPSSFSSSSPWTDLSELATGMTLSTEA